MHEWNTYGSEHPFHHEICRLEPLVLRLHLSLLRCCSQIYMEAALIPFIHNTFSFAEGAVLPQFISSLVPAQATAITSLALNNIFAADLFDWEYWYGLPELRHLTVTVRGHEECISGNGFFGDHRRLNDSYLASARKVWQDAPTHEPLEHFNLDSFKLRVVCSSSLLLKDCPTHRDWQLWADTIG